MTSAFSYLIMAVSVHGRVESAFSKAVVLRHGDDFTDVFSSVFLYL